MQRLKSSHKWGVQGAKPPAGGAGVSPEAFSFCFLLFFVAGHYYTRASGKVKYYKLYGRITSYHIR